MVLPKAVGDAGGRVTIVEYTDPYSVWCWGCEPALRRIEYRYPDVEVSTVMGGLFEDFTPMKESWARMSGGKWREAVETFLTAVAGQHKMPTNVGGMLSWMDDFRSTWPACIAVKGAERQGREPGRRYLRRLREAGQVEGRDIGREETQVAVARESGLDAAKLTQTIDDGSALSAFREDLAECRLRGVSGFPSFDVRRGELSVRLEGYRTWDEFENVIRELHPDLRTRPLESDAASVHDVLRHFGRCASLEVAAVLGTSNDDAEISLEELEATGGAKREVYGPAHLWRLA